MENRDTNIESFNSNIGDSIPFVSMVYKDTIDLVPDKECSICIEKYVNGDIIYNILNCSHYFHRKCLEDWNVRSNTCPLCRCIIDPNREVKEEVNPFLFGYNSNIYRLPQIDGSMLYCENGDISFPGSNGGITPPDSYDGVSFPNSYDGVSFPNSYDGVSFPIYNRQFFSNFHDEFDSENSDEESEIDYPEEPPYEEDEENNIYRECNGGDEEYNNPYESGPYQVSYSI